LRPVGTRPCAVVSRQRPPKRLARKGRWHGWGFGCRSLAPGAVPSPSLPGATQLLWQGPGVAKRSGVVATAARSPLPARGPPRGLGRIARLALPAAAGTTISASLAEEGRRHPRCSGASTPPRRGWLAASRVREESTATGRVRCQAAASGRCCPGCGRCRLKHLRSRDAGHRAGRALTESAQGAAMRGLGSGQWRIASAASAARCYASLLSALRHKRRSESKPERRSPR